jgi:hypothetical protein
MGRNLFARVENSMNRLEIDECSRLRTSFRAICPAIPPWPNDPSPHFYNTNHPRDTEDTARRLMERRRTLLARFCDAHAATVSMPVGELYTRPACPARLDHHRPGLSGLQVYRSLPDLRRWPVRTEANMAASGKRRIVGKLYSYPGLVTGRPAPSRTVSLRNSTQHFVYSDHTLLYIVSLRLICLPRSPLRERISRPEECRQTLQLRRLAPKEIQTIQAMSKL